jgi:hypothetical protein
MARQWMKICAGAGLFLSLVWTGPVLAEEEEFVGSPTCSECHQEQYETFAKYSKKAHTRKGVEKMFSDLNEAEKKECYVCHTTGYGRGGFVSYEKTPEFADVGCETCHGAGGEHVAYGGDPELITRRPSVESCEKCHNAERVKDFNYKPLLFSGAH